MAELALLRSAPLSSGGLEAIREVLFRLYAGASLSPAEVEAGFLAILHEPDGEARSTLLGGYLTAIFVRGPSAEEIAALIRAAFSLDGHDPDHKLEARLPAGKRLIAAAGSGKKGVKIMNITTPSLLVAASLGCYTAKIGSASTSSLTGSADLIELLGVDTALSAAASTRVLERSGFGFYKIENMIPAFDRVYGGRFHVPNPLSFALPALLAPVRYDALLYGLAHANVDLSLEVFRRFGIDDALVVSATHDDVHFIDEVGIFGTTRMIGMRHGHKGRLRYIEPTELLGLPRYTPADIAQGRCAEDNVRTVVSILAGRAEGAREDIVCINAASVLYLAGMAEDLRDGFHRAKQAVRSGLPLEKLREVVELTGGDRTRLQRLAAGA